jgi:hypothetical protein
MMPPIPIVSPSAHSDAIDNRVDASTQIGCPVAELVKTLLARGESQRVVASGDVYVST